ncbi:pentatricopeptide repeat-containing protein At1g11290, chloroplastic [Selaginella moellendorffii]|nr:pentatricopeptide repeat-containing protein At1g11290, chloroplastic [Selaginella moellendorffii]|eukprot:XP_002973132.2 pentatricopeptide repeat-containing protein At1g11290, chloroplastic [Selaginella moellendorffii]
MSAAAAIFAKLVGSSSSGGGDVVLWTTMIGIYAQRGETSASLHHFRTMQLHGVRPNRVTFITVLTACSSPAWLPVGIWIHRHHHHRRQSSRLETSMGNALMSMYIKCGELRAGKRVFDEMERQRDVISWNTIIAGYAAEEQQQLVKAFEILWEMLQDGATKPDCITIVTLLNACNKPALLEHGKFLHSLVPDCGVAVDPVLFNALIHMYAKCGSLEAASQMFQQQQRQTEASVWGAMIIALSQQGLHRQAIQLFQRMQQEGVKPDKVAFTAALDSAATALDDSSAASTARGFHAQALESGLLQGNAVVATALINLLGNTGAMAEAYTVFTNVVERDIVCWNAMMSVYAQHGHTTRALDLFQELQHQGMGPNDVTFVSLLSLCSHAGLLDAGIQCFLSMTIDHSLQVLTPELTGCVIDLFARVGRLADAHDFIGRMPREQARVIQWMSLMCASRVQGDLELSGCAAKEVLELDPSNPAAYVALSNRQSTYAVLATT